MNKQTKKTKTNKNSRFRNNRISVLNFGVTPPASSPGVGI
jgi:hypothetical protein